jgi:diguanylate cyclase
MVTTTDISEQAASRKNPAVIARIALTTLAQAAMPPTPENYVREYRRASGQPNEAFDELHLQSCASESTVTLISLVETIAVTTKGLSNGIDRFGGDLKTLVGASENDSPEGVRALVEQLTALGLALKKDVEDSREELESTRKRLDQVTAELERSHAQARIDPLTGSVNRRGMEEIIVREISRARRAKIPFSLAILDIDHFKRVNDEYGHDTGDQALIHLVTVIKGGLRDSDVVCRYGGEEFAVILPGSGVQGALFVVDRLRAMVEKARLPIASGVLQICISAGVAELTSNEDRDTLLKRADNALYKAKRAGRNRVYAG